ncbi:MAG: ArsR family transcriptional regulator [Anaerolineales bacterium]|nr:ArsR family transcriptional regulator [Anaerolineales bacterium]
MPVQNFPDRTPAPEVSVALEPVVNIFESLLVLATLEGHVGLGGWAQETLDAMTPEERQRHVLVMVGLYFATVPDRLFPNFPAYLDHLAALEPEALRDKMLQAYYKVRPHDSQDCSQELGDWEAFDKDAVLSSADAYVGFLVEHFGEEHVDFELERRAYRYASDPPAMHGLIVSHLRHMWERYMAAEWERVRPMLLDCVRAFAQVDLNKMTRLEAVEFVIDQEIGDLRKIIENKSRRMVLVPNAHIGPYLWSFKREDVNLIPFGARLPKGVQMDVPDLSRNEILVRLSALADDSRLRILKFVSDNGEQRSQDIIKALDMSQSTASRHLMQLSATGYLSERRCEGAKCYQLNPARVEETLQALAHFLLVEQAERWVYQREPSVSIS